MLREIEETTHTYSFLLLRKAIGEGKLSWGFGVDGKDYKSKAKLGPRFVFDHLGSFTDRSHFGTFSAWQILQYLGLRATSSAAAKSEAMAKAKTYIKKNMMADNDADRSVGFQVFAKYTYTFELFKCLWDCPKKTQVATNASDAIVVESNETLRF